MSGYPSDQHPPPTPHFITATNARRLPKPLVFNLTDPLHMQFVASAARLRAFLFGLARPSPDAWSEAEV